jgi:hypothetical protein
MNIEKIEKKIKEYISQFDYKTDNESIPTKPGYFEFMRITEKDLEGDSERAYELKMGLLHIHVFLEKSLFMKDCKKLNLIMDELVNNFGYHY